jgi:hypothetical protein
MRGTLRFILGLLVTWMAVGAMDSATNTGLVLLVLVALAGLYSMYSGARALQEY